MIHRLATAQEGDRAGDRDQSPVIVIGPPTGRVQLLRADQGIITIPEIIGKLRRTISRMTDLKFTKLIRVHVSQESTWHDVNFAGLGQDKGDAAIHVKTRAGKPCQIARRLREIDRARAYCNIVAIFSKLGPAKTL